MNDRFYSGDVPAKALENEYFRSVLFTTERSQLVLMAIEAGCDIGDEVHHDVDQVLIFVAGEGVAILDGERMPVRPGSVVVVPAGTRHNFIADSGNTMKLYTVYTPPEHAPGTVHRTRAEADAAELEHHR